MMNTAFQLGGGALTSNRATFSLFIKKVFHQVKSFFKRENKNFAFTLAETLIVMGIIGVVAALTIPNLNASTGEAEKVAKVKKNYAVLNEALSRAVVKYGPVRTWFVNDGDDNEKMSKRFADRISEFLKLTKPVEKNDNDDYTFTLADGTSVYIDYFGDNGPCSHTSVQARHLGDLMIDIDGDKGKSIEGIDKFAFDITNIGLVPQGGFGWDGNCDCAYWCCSPLYKKYDGGEEYYYYGAALWVITHGNMDYLKCGADLDWDTKTSCK